MEVLLLTILLSLILAAGFVVCFVRAALRRDGRGLEQQSLLPLAGDDVDSRQADQS